jgi:SAM-dependent methyltransferase
MWAGTTGPACRLCLGATRFAFRRKVLEKIDVSYWRCESCGGVQTDRPTWLDAAYAIPGVHVDVGIASRTVKNWLALTTLLDRIAFPREALAVDFGGGTGLLARLMRDVGYRFTASDRYSEPFFVDYFSQAGIAGLHPELVTAFEVFEHFPDPHEQIDEILASRPRLVVFSTWFCDGQPDDWIYYAPECGQHVFFYTQDGLRRFAAARGYDLELASFFYVLVRRDGLEAAARAALAGFLSDSEALVRGRVGDIFDSVKFGNDYIQRDYLAADKLFRANLEERDITVAAPPPRALESGHSTEAAAEAGFDGSRQPRKDMSMTSAINANPQWNFEGDNAKLLALGVHNQDTSDFDAIVASRHGRKPEIMGRLALQGSDIVMDLGSGMGLIAEVIAPYVSKLHCCDISENFLDDCRRRTSHLANLQCHKIEYADLSSVYGRNINKIYSTLLFIHFNFYDIVYYLQEINKVLVKGGQLYFDFNDGERYRLDNKEDSFQEHIALYKQARESWVFGCMHMTSARILENLAPQLGFRIVGHWTSSIAFSQMLLEKIAEL